MPLNLKTLKQAFMQIVWETPNEQMTKWQLKGVVVLRITHLVVRDVLDGLVTLRAMSLVYTTLLALVPLFAVSFSVLKGFGVHNQVEPTLHNLLAPLGDKGIEISDRIIEFVENTEAGVLGAVGLVLLIYTVVSLLQKIESAFNYTWHVSQHRPLIQRFSNYLSVVLIGPVMVFTALGLTASITNFELVQQVIGSKTIGSLLELIGHLLPFVLVIMAFTFIYILVPNTRVKIKPALTGALVAGVLWQATSWGFAAFVANSTKYTAIYSTFATLVIFMIWLYLNWLILLTGCGIAFYSQNPERQKLQSSLLLLSNHMREKLALLIMAMVGKHYYQHLPAWSIERLANELNTEIEVCELLIGQLLNTGLLVRTSEQPATFVPANALETIPLKDIIGAVRRSGETELFSYHYTTQAEIIDTLSEKIESSIKQSLGEQTLRDLVLLVQNNRK